MLKSAYNYGVKAACERYKIAIPLSGAPMGADYGVAPRGEETSHGTERTVYPPTGGRNPPTDDPNYNATTDSHGHGRDADALWNISEYNRHAPGYSGEWGQEVIG
jgi:hypothetical protein